MSSNEISSNEITDDIDFLLNDKFENAVKKYGIERIKTKLYKATTNIDDDIIYRRIYKTGSLILSKNFDKNFEGRDYDENKLKITINKQIYYILYFCIGIEDDGLKVSVVKEDDKELYRIYNINLIEFFEKNDLTNKQFNTIFNNIKNITKLKKIYQNYRSLINEKKMYEKIGSGAYGTIVSPHLPCSENNDKYGDKDLVSKISDPGDREYKLLRIVKNIDPQSLFHFKSLDDCEVDIDLYSMINGRKQVDYEEKSNIVLKKALFSFKEFNDLHLKKDPTMILKAATSLFAGCYIMNSNKFYHLDIKVDNILVDQSNELNPTNSDYSLKYIDFNFSCHLSENKLKYSRLFSRNLSSYYFVWSPEVIYLSKSMRWLLNNKLTELFEVDDRNINDKKYDQSFKILEKIINPYISHFEIFNSRFGQHIGARSNLIKMIKLYYNKVYSKLNNKQVNIGTDFNDSNQHIAVDYPDSNEEIEGDQHDTELIDNFNMWILERIDIYSLCSTLIKIIFSKSNSVLRKLKEFLYLISGPSLVDQFDAETSLIHYLKFLIDIDLIDEREMNRILEKTGKYINL
jgi:hypothetical protein